MTDTLNICPHCGNIHTGVCPLIKAIEYYPDGITVKRVEYKTPSDIMAPMRPLDLPYTVTCGDRT